MRMRNEGEWVRACVRASEWERLTWSGWCSCTHCIIRECCRIKSSHWKIWMNEWDASNRIFATAYGNRHWLSRWFFSLHLFSLSMWRHRECGKYLHGSLLLLIYFRSIGTKLETTKWLVANVCAAIVWIECVVEIFPMRATCAYTIHGWVIIGRAFNSDFQNVSHCTHTHT